MDYRIEDFTESEYRSLLELAQRRWTLVGFDAVSADGRLCLWRHDVDFSVHRAARLAELEAEAGVRATYFILLHSPFYNVFEPAVAERIARIRELGHWIGVHFDVAGHLGRIRGREELDAAIAFESRVLGEYFDVTPSAVSFHNPDTRPGLVPDDDLVAGLPNTYGRTVRARFGYVSDSNGYWRFRRLRDVLESGADERLQVLTHPDWWTPVPMPPRARVQRCIDGRARRQQEDYDAFLDRYGRLNVR